MNDDEDRDALIAATRERLAIMDMMLPEWTEHLQAARSLLKRLETRSRSKGDRDGGRTGGAPPKTSS